MYFTRLWLILLHADLKITCNIRLVLLPRESWSKVIFKVPSNPKHSMTQQHPFQQKWIIPREMVTFLSLSTQHRAAQWHTSTWSRRVLLLPLRGFSCPSPKPQTRGCGSQAQSDSIQQTMAFSKQGEELWMQNHLQLLLTAASPFSAQSSASPPLGEGIPEHTRCIC